jgi:hypothetical protein
MGGTLALKFPTKEIRDRMFSFVQEHLLTLEFTDEDCKHIVRDESTIEYVHIEKARGNKITFDYPIWFSGPYKLWLEVFVKWASFTAGTRKTKVDGKTFDHPVPIVYNDAVGYYELKVKDDGQPDYYNCIEHYLYPFSCESYGNVRDVFTKEFWSIENSLDRQSSYFKFFGEDLKPITSKMESKLIEMTKLWAE